MGINLVVQFISYIIEKCKSKEGLASVAEDISDESCCGKKAFLFLFPARSSFFELVFTVLITGVYGSLMTYFLHKTTYLNINRDWNLDYYNVLYALTIVTVIFSSYSLFSRPIPESTPYLSNDSFSIYSSHYQRVGYSLIIVGCVCIAEFGAEANGNLMKLQGPFIGAYIVNFIVFILQMFGVLSNPLVTLMWAMEQADIHALGSTPRASDSRILMSLSLNAGIVIAMYFINDFSNAIVLGVILAWIFSHNFTLGIGMVRPHEVINEKL